MRQKSCVWRDMEGGDMEGRLLSWWGHGGCTFFMFQLGCYTYIYPFFPSPQTAIYNLPLLSSFNFKPGTSSNTMVTSHISRVCTLIQVGLPLSTC